MGFGPCPKCGGPRIYNAKWHKRVCKACNARKMANWRSANRERNNARARKCRLKKKVWLDDYKASHPCVICGESHIACLDFHHRDPNKKLGNISIAVSKKPMDWLKAEVAKCDIICANCHRKLHWDEKQR